LVKTGSGGYAQQSAASADTMNENSVIKHVNSWSHLVVQGTPENGSIFRSEARLLLRVRVLNMNANELSQLIFIINCSNLSTQRLEEEAAKQRQ
jgi:hypothetical protein